MQLWVAPEALLSPGPGLFLTVCGFQLALRHSERVQCDAELQLPWLPRWMSCVECACMCSVYVRVCLGGYIGDMCGTWMLCGPWRGTCDVFECMCLWYVVVCMYGECEEIYVTCVRCVRR